MAKYTMGNHAEVPDQTPVELPLGYRPPETLQAMIARLVRYESDNASKQGNETFEEADDFDCDDEGEINSPYEMKDMQEEYAPVVRKRDDNGDEGRNDQSVSAAGRQTTPKKSSKNEVGKTQKLVPKDEEGAEESAHQA